MSDDLFSIHDVEHASGDPECSACYSDDHPKPCGCGGLIHEQFIGEGEFTVGTEARCDRCGERLGVGPVPEDGASSDPTAAPFSAAAGESQADAAGG